MPKLKLPAWLNWPPLAWIVPLSATLGSGIGFMAYKSYVGDPLASLNGKVDVVVQRMDKIETNEQKTGENVAKVDGKIDTLIQLTKDRRTANAGYESRQSPQVYGVQETK